MRCITCGMEIDSGGTLTQCAVCAYPVTRDMTMTMDAIGRDDALVGPFARALVEAVNRHLVGMVSHFNLDDFNQSMRRIVRDCPRGMALEARLGKEHGEVVLTVRQVTR